jgi:hypothetical protein
MTQFIKITLVDNDEKLYFNAHYVHAIIPAFLGVENTTIRILDKTAGYHYREFKIKETPEEILAQLK